MSIDQTATPSAQQTPVKIDVWSDVACPWCYVGKRRLETALADFDGPVEIEYHSFELSPDTPVDFEGTAADFLARHKGMPLAQVETMLGQMTELAAAEGLDYDFEHVHQTKTLKAHELLHHAKEHGRQGEMKERLLKAYFVEGKHVGYVDTLVELAAEVGLDADAARAALDAGTHADDVAADIAQARAFGIQGVPFYVLENRYGISGAQSPDVFRQALAQVAAERAGLAEEPVA
ncbi:putative DsbA family dithiol-disulfide isomerase [Sediminihabitans luteus]|uniref:Putative DsbA family dithiol-disulfide isomerase n=1 Tax=Sediminihabitans luteus TaxID=1138585 RepID=A0A2M9CC38_9CELL|nr:DsbA family oxidoreductase [Sediminihabitans luteus]PJJ68603.1 putative DsbA family dithiol-disulfide isomerase [Sediminihabitans luteus]GII99941.1 DSBA oxidoreductase [Sediminihabitans luteus]